MKSTRLILTMAAMLLGGSALAAAPGPGGSAVDTGRPGIGAAADWAGPEAIALIEAALAAE